MLNREPNSILRLIRRIFDYPHMRTCPDQELLRRFCREQDEAAFEAILRRHGPMVLDVCRAMLPNEADAEDAFQATFVVFAIKAKSIQKAGSLASWLHGVAYRTARKAQTAFALRQKHESLFAVREDPTMADELSWREARQIIHEELKSLPDPCRAAVILCYFEGMTQDQAAEELGLPKGTLKGRLERGRELLRLRLVRRGLGPAAIVAASALPTVTMAADLPAGLLGSLVKASTSLAAGQSAAGLVPANVVALSKGVLKAMLLKRIIVASVTFALVGLFCVGSYAITVYAWAGPQQPKDEKRAKALPALQPLEKGPALVPAEAVREGPKPAPEKEKEIAWGKVEHGLQAGLAFRPGGVDRTCSIGDSVTLVVTVRNVTTEPLGFKFPPDATGFFGPALVVEDEKGKQTPLVSGIAPIQGRLAPGESKELGSIRLPVQESASAVMPALRLAPGVYKIHHTTLPPSTGQVELKVKENPEPDKKTTLQEDLRMLHGTWRTGEKIKPRLELRVQVVERDGRVEASAFYLPMAYHVPVIELKQVGKERVIEHKNPAKQLGLTSVPYRFDGNTLILDIRDGSLKGEHRLIWSDPPIELRNRPLLGTNSPRVIWIGAPNSWWLDINKDGSGRLGYGSTSGDDWAFKAGTFDAAKVSKEIAGLASDEKGGIGTHFQYRIDRGEGMPALRGYTRDVKVIPDLLEKAYEAAHVAESLRGSVLWKKHAPRLPKEK